MRIDRVVMVAIVIAVVMVVPMIMPVIMMVMMMRHLQPAFPGAEGVAQRTIRHVRPRGRGTLPLHMVVVAFLHRADLTLEPDDGSAVFAQIISCARNFQIYLNGFSSFWVNILAQPKN